MITCVTRGSAVTYGALTGVRAERWRGTIGSMLTRVARAFINIYNKLY